MKQSVAGYLVIRGAPGIGFTYYGIFDTYEKAQEWAEGQVHPVDKWFPYDTFWIQEILKGTDETTT
jgi:hypothetical protein